MIAALAAGTIAIKAGGPLVLGNRPLGQRALGVVALIAPAVISALVIYETFSDQPDGIVVDARVAGLAAAGLALARAPADDRGDRDRRGLHRGRARADLTSSQDLHTVRRFLHGTRTRTG